MISQVKAKTAMEKVHAKSLKKAIKTGNVEQVEQANRQEYQQLTREQDEKHKELRKTQAEVKRMELILPTEDHRKRLQRHNYVYRKI